MSEAITNEVLNKRRQTYFARTGYYHPSQNPKTNNLGIEYWIEKGFSLEEAKQKVSFLQRNNSQKSSLSISKIGTKFIDKLEEELGIVFEREITLFDKFTVDSVNFNYKIVIEFYGSFWHMHPTLFEDDEIHPVTGWKATSKRNEDNGRIKFLKKNNFKTFVIWDIDDQNQKINEIKKYFGGLDEGR